MMTDRNQLRQVRSALGGKGAALERRSLKVPVDSVEARGDGKDKEYMFRGLASRTDVPYEVMDIYGSYMETINSGAFRATLGEDPQVLFLVNHSGLPLAATRSGTMRLWESERGLEVEASLAYDNPIAQSVVSAVKRGDATELSFAFRVTGQHWNDGYDERVISAVNLHRGDVSIVTYGANPYTTTGAEDGPGGDSSDPLDLPDALSHEFDVHEYNNKALLDQQLREELMFLEMLM